MELLLSNEHLLASFMYLFCPLNYLLHFYRDFTISIVSTFGYFLNALVALSGSKTYTKTT